jgi:hypothetical protein
MIIHRRLHLLLPLLAAGSMLLALPAAAEETINDPRAWCAETTDLIADKKLDRIPARVVSATRGGVSEEGANSFMAIRPILENGDVGMNTFLVEKRYGEDVWKIWHAIVFGTEDLFIRCTFYKIDGKWTLWRLSFNTDEEKIGLP